MRTFKFLRALRQAKNSDHAQSQAHFEIYKTDYPSKVRRADFSEPLYPCCFGAHLAAALQPIKQIRQDLQGQQNLPYYAVNFRRGEALFFRKLGLDPHSYPDKHVVWELFSKLGITSDEDQDPFSYENWEMELQPAIARLEKDGPAVFAELMRHRGG